jgi:UDP-2,3-diacylglucosamine pyrophosphatase LpxH
MAKKIVLNPSLENTFKNAFPLSLDDDQNIVIISDFHMGNGRKSDDFLHNGKMVETILRGYYLKNDWHLILNGDIEELQKFPLQKIRERWESMYSLFTEFHKKKKLFKVCGNHDIKLLLELSHKKIFPLHDGVNLNWCNQDFFIYHGHQSSAFYSQFNKIIEFIIHYIVKPLGIKNISDRDNNWKKHRLEKQSYSFSQYKRIVSIIGHTHRPLFESQSRKEMLRYKIEYLLRNYRDASFEKHKSLKTKIKDLKKELDELNKEDKFGDLTQSIYSDGIPVPCLFNSGCAIGKRGITCIELSKGKISLTYWFNPKIPQKRKLLKKSVPLEGTDYHRTIIKEDDISYLSDCIELLLG